MNNKKLLSIIDETISETLRGSTGAENLIIEKTQRGNGYCICVRVGHRSGLTGLTEYSLPATCMVFGIQGEGKVKDTIRTFFARNDYLFVEEI